VSTEPRAGERALRLGLGACALLGMVACALVVLRSSPAPDPARTGAELAGLALAPLLHGRVRDAARRRGSSLRWSNGLADLVVLALFAPIALEGALAFLFGALLAAQSLLLLAWRDDRAAALGAAASPCALICALAVEPSRLLLALLPLSGIAALVTLALWNARATQRQVRRGTPEREAPQRRRERLLGSLLRALGVLLATSALYVATEEVLARSSAAAPAASRSAPAARASLAADAERAAAGRAAPGRGPGGGHTEDLSFGGATSPFSDEVLLSVAPGPGTRRRRALHLRHQVLDELSATGVRQSRRSRPPILEDAADSAGADGWTWVVAPERGEAYEEYAIHARPLPVLDYGWTVLFAPEPLAAVGLERVRYDPDQVLVAPWVEREPFDYRVRVQARDAGTARLTGVAARSSDARDLGLPPESPAVEALRARAAELTSGAADDLARVRAVVGHFQRGYAYDRTGDDFQGPEALAHLLLERRGYCTLFAGAAALMLRTQGIPARLATGFVAHEWSEERGEWTVRERDAHAWIEVRFEGVGWVTFDPTPPATDEGGGGFDPFADEGAGPPFLARLGGSLERWIAGQGGTLGQVLATLLGAPLEGLRRAPSFALLVLGGLLGLLHAARSRAGAQGAGRRPEASERDGLVELQRAWVAALARAGCARRRGETLRALGARAARARVGLEDLPRGVELVYAARFGARELAQEDRALLERLNADLTRAAAAARSPG